jgi:Spy/CpxP family protein refolding chaperone
MSRPIRVLILLIGFVAFDAAQPASAADPRYPDWPCAQAKVPEISLAAVWAGPSLDDVAGKWKDNAEISALVARLSARRTPIEDAEAQIAKFLSTAGTNKSEVGKKLFAGVFETLNAQRSSVMNGLERTTRKQREAAGKIRADTAALHDLQDAATPDQAKIDALANQVGWQTHIFEDRSKVIRFVCDVPNAIDQRIFALGRAIQQGMEE